MRQVFEFKGVECFIEYIEYIKHSSYHKPMEKGFDLIAVDVDSSLVSLVCILLSDIYN